MLANTNSVLIFSLEKSENKLEEKNRTSYALHEYQRVKYFKNAMYVSHLCRKQVNEQLNLSIPEMPSGEKWQANKRIKTRSKTQEWRKNLDIAYHF